MKTGFDNDKYILIQSERIKKRISEFGGKLYLEFGGKLYDDFHASRVLPGFEPDSKLRMLKAIGSDVEILIAICADDIEKNKQRGDLGISYAEDALRLMDVFRSMGFYVGGVVITQYCAQQGADNFRKKLTGLGIKSYIHYPIKDYPHNVDDIVSEEGYGRNEYVPTTRPLVVVTAPGPGSGKMATCLSQLYHDLKRGISSGYAKFETFPVWDLPLTHPVNQAYEAATADLNDVNMIDPYHLEAYGVTAVNYNRDVEIFPVMRALFERLLGKSPYMSPTDMGVNMIASCITDDEVCREASKREILRRFYSAQVEAKRKGEVTGTLRKMEIIIKKAGITPEICPAVGAALLREKTTGLASAALELPDGRVVTGKTSSLLGCAAALLLNCLKELAGIPKEIKLIPSNVVEPITDLKINNLGHHNPRLHTDEILVALCVSATTNPVAALAQQQLSKLKGCDAHFSVIPSQVDEKIYKRLGINLSCEPKYELSKLYHK
ncbi:MAG: DUF1846 domain-containing protein [Clostridiales bacterium]|nr:DUF1846 domain-containing protein [Clostridiales bacterium]